jgi:hypothetical protein
LGKGKGNKRDQIYKKKKEHQKGFIGEQENVIKEKRMSLENGKVSLKKIRVSLENMKRVGEEKRVSLENSKLRVEKKGCHWRTENSSWRTKSEKGSSKGNFKIEKGCYWRTGNRESS